MSVQALYLHIPFCKRKCAYCDFTSYATQREDPLIKAYCQALEQQLHEAHQLGLLEGARTAYIGGGTPTHVGESVVGLAACVASSAALDEFTMEANPESASLTLLSKLRDVGVSRISMGIQSLNDAELAALGRIHNAQTAIEALNMAFELGFYVSADLMCAIPLQTSTSWAATLSGVLDAGVHHVSVYPLMIEEGTAFARAVEAGELEIPDDGDEADRMEEAEAILSAQGFSRYEVASYAQLGFACLHNQAYWTGASYLGLGTGASSMFNVADNPDLLRAFPQIGDIPAGTARIRLTCTTDRHRLSAHHALAEQTFDVEFLTLRESLAEDLMLGARMSCGPTQELVSRARDVMGSELDDCLASLIDDGFMTGSLAPTRKGWLLGNELYGRLWSLAQ